MTGTARERMLVEELARDWELTLGPELPGRRLACVVEARTADGRDALLKLPSPWARGADELAALQAWAGDGAPLVLAADGRSGAVLLERVVPGTVASGADAREVAALLRRLNVFPLAGLPDLDGIVRRRLDRAVAEGRANRAREAWGREALERLARKTPPSVLLHGDFEERNLLRCSRRGLCAIDPLPCVGDPAYDAAYWAHASGRPGRRARFEAISAALDVEPARVRDWCGVIAVLG